MSCYYVGLDVHKSSICIAVLNAGGKLVIESVIETSAATICTPCKLQQILKEDRPTCPL